MKEPNRQDLNREIRRLTWQIREGAERDPDALDALLDEMRETIRRLKAVPNERQENPP